MLPVTEAFMNAFKESEFECELYESETEDRVHILVNGEVCAMRGKKMRPGDTAEFNGTRYLVAAEEHAAGGAEGRNTPKR